MVLYEGCIEIPGRPRPDVSRPLRERDREIERKQMWQNVSKV